MNGWSIAELESALNHHGPGARHVYNDTGRSRAHPHMFGLRSPAGVSPDCFQWRGTARTMGLLRVPPLRPVRIPAADAKAPPDRDASVVEQLLTRDDCAADHPSSVPTLPLLEDDGHDSSQRTRSGV
jgi:hypothetical protein